MKKLIITAVAAIAIALPNDGLATDCRITSCSSFGGQLYKCYTMLKQEVLSKQRDCKQLTIVSGVSAYLQVAKLAQSNSKLCIANNATLSMHLAYDIRNFKVYPVNSRVQQYFLNMLTPAMRKYFISHGGLRKTGLANVLLMTGIPANSTGIRICK
jgi:hypothetical protein